MQATLHWQYGWLKEMPLGGSNAIGRLFWRKESNLALYLNLKIISLSGIGCRADTAMNSSHIANAFTLAVIVKRHPP